MPFVPAEEPRDEVDPCPEDTITTSITVHRFRCIECGHTAYPTYHRHDGERYAIVKVDDGWYCQKCGRRATPSYICEECGSRNTAAEECAVLSPDETPAFIADGRGSHD